MSILRNQRLLALLGLSLLMFLTSPAQAQWPTLDMTAIKEGITSKIELVKQSKIVTEATQLGGKMNSAIGDAKSSMTKFAGDNIEKAKKQAEKLKKEKERLDKQKEKMDKLKEKAEKQKKKLEKAKKAMDDAKKMKADAEKKIQEGKDMANEAKSKVDEAKSKVDEAKQMADDAKSTAQGAINDAKSTVNDAKTTAGSAISDVKNKKDELESSAGISSGGSKNDDFVEDYVADYEAGINSDDKVYEETPEISETPEIPTAPANNGKSPEDILSSVSGAAFQGLHDSQLSDREILDVLQKPLDDEMIAKMREKGVDEKTIDSLVLQKGLKALSGGTGASAAPASEVATPTEGLSKEPSMDEETAAAAPELTASEAATPAATAANGKIIKRQAFGRQKATGSSVAVKTRATSGAVTLNSKAVVGTKAKSSAPSGSKLKPSLNKTAVSPVTAATPAVSLSTTAVKADSLQKAPTAPAATNSISGTAATVSASGRAVRTRMSANPSAAAPATVLQAQPAVTNTESAPAATAPATRGFRQRAIIKKDVQPLQQGAWLETLEPIKIAVYNNPEILMFGAEASSEEIPDGVVDNGEYEETIMTEKMLELCRFGKDKLNDTSMIQNCMKDLIKHQSDSDSQVAEQGKTIHTQLVAEAVVATVSESMAMKNIAANYVDKLDKQEEDLGGASTTRDDSGALAMTNKELQYAINKMLSMHATQLSLNALNLIGGFTKEDLGEEEEDEAGEAE